MSDLNPVDVVEAVGRVASDSFAEDPEAFLSGDPSPDRDPEAEDLPAGREGLPPTYRMRADEHYVDELSRHRAPDLDTEDTRPVDGVESESIEDSGARVLELLASEIASVEHSATLLGDQSSALSQRVAADLIRAQARRAAWLLSVRDLLAPAGEHDPRPQAIGALLTRVREGLKAECRLAGVALQIQASDWQATVTVDADRVVTGLTGAVLATVALVAGSEGAVIRVTAVTLGGMLTAIEVRQDTVAVGGSTRRRFFDPEWTDRPGGALAAVAAEASAASARRHGGDGAFIPRERRGSTVRLNFSRRS